MVAIVTDTQITEGPQLGVIGAHLEGEHPQDSGAGEVGAAVLVFLAVQYAIVAVVIAAAGLPFAVVHQLRDTVAHHDLKGEGHLPGARADPNQSHHGVQNLQAAQKKVPLGHHRLVVPFAKRVWFLMTMALPRSRTAIDFTVAMVVAR